jgi:hypothetical protein
MKALLALGFVTLVSGLTTLLPPAAYGGACPKGCGRQAKACVQTARVSLRACLAGCRETTPAVDGCASACTTRFRAAKSACGADLASCVGMCPPPPPPNSCLGAFLDTCGQELAACAQGVIAQAKQCVRGCKGVADRVGCLGGCAAGAETGAAQCAASFDACVGACGCPGGCDDGNPCTLDRCVQGMCTHECLCVGPGGAVTCCPGPGLCPVSTTTTTTTTTLPGQPCTTDAECDDGNPCTADRCVGGTCEHLCLCVDPTGALTCCPGPAALCTRPCGPEASGMCGGTCPAGATCESLATGSATCGCVSGVGGPCGGNTLAPPPVCAPGLVCQQSNADATGVCVTPTCIPFFATGCTQTSDCCEPCTVLQRAPCAVCLQGQCVGTP